MTSDNRTTQEKLETPVLFLIYNRPDLTQSVFEAIRKAKPTRLFIAADGPKQGGTARCRKAREVVASIDWACDVKKLYREQNLGSGRAVSEAITWFFDHVGEGIILEDDCLPAPDFFRFCSELLERYRYDTRVMEIGGNNFVHEAHYSEYSYSFSNHNLIWGWATWRRAWKLFDLRMTKFLSLKETGDLKNLFKSYQEREWFMSTFERSVGDNSIWDYQWEFTRRINSGLSIVPSRNLVRNIGLGSDATHTFDPRGPGATLKEESIAFPLIHPPFVMVDEAKEREFFIRNFTTFRSRLKSNIRRLLPDFAQPLLR